MSGQRKNFISLPPNLREMGIRIRASSMRTERVEYKNAFLGPLLKVFQRAS
jgi:hypothetical protein